MDEPVLRNRVSRVLATAVIAAMVVVDGETVELVHVVASTDAATIAASTPIRVGATLRIPRTGASSTGGTHRRPPGQLGP